MSESTWIWTDLESKDWSAFIPQARVAQVGEPYGRNIIHNAPDMEVMLAHWSSGAACLPHDHAGGHGKVLALQGIFEETRYEFRNSVGLRPISTQRHHSGEWLDVSNGTIHNMTTATGGVTLHFYHPGHGYMRVFDEKNRRTLEVENTCGAWVPNDASLVRSSHFW